MVTLDNADGWTDRQISGQERKKLWRKTDLMVRLRSSQRDGDGEGDDERGQRQNKEEARETGRDGGRSRRNKQKSGGKDSVINSRSSSPLMRHTSNNGVHLAGKSA